MNECKDGWHGYTCRCMNPSDEPQREAIATSNRPTIDIRPRRQRDAQKR